jgi:hypothetical protein
VSDPDDTARPRFTQSQLEAVADGRVFLARRGEPIDLKLRPKQRQQLEQAKTDGFITFRGRSADNAVATLYRLWCETWKRPFIQIWPGRRWAAILIDTFSCQTEFTDEAFGRLRRLLGERGRKGPFDLGRVHLVGRHVPMEQADAVAAGCFRIAGDLGALVGPLTIDNGSSRRGWIQQRRPFSTPTRAGVAGRCGASTAGTGTSTVAKRGIESLTASVRAPIFRAGTYCTLPDR